MERKTSPFERALASVMAAVMFISSFSNFAPVFAEEIREIIDPGNAIVEEITESGLQKNGDETGDGRVITIDDSRNVSDASLENNSETVSDTEATDEAVTDAESQTVAVEETEIDADSETVVADETETPAGDTSENSEEVVTDDNSAGEPAEAEEEEKSEPADADADETVSQQPNIDTENQEPEDETYSEEDLDEFDRELEDEEDFLPQSFSLRPQPFSLRTGGNQTQEAPGFEKTVIANSNGTSTVKLDIIGKNRTEVNTTKANVVIVLDSSGSMDRSTGQKVYVETNENNRREQYYGLVNGNYVEIQRFAGKWWYGLNEYTGTRYKAYEVDRMTAAKNSAVSVATSLLNLNTSNGVSDLVQIAFIDFDTTAKTPVGPTTDLNTLTNAINSAKAEGGTNWEAALKSANSVSFGDNDKTYVIFISDGNPTYHGNVSGSGQEGDSNVATCYNAAKDDAKAIVEANKELYAIGAYGNVTRMQSLVTDSGSPRNHYYSAADTDALNTALREIANAISSNIGTSNVKVNDGISSLSSTAVNGTATNFRYYKKAASEGATYVTWADAPSAYLSNNQVIWDLSGVELENNVHYAVEFDIWPSQAAYDLIADLNNGKVTKTDAELSALGISKDENNRYFLKTNTSLSVTYGNGQTVNGLTPGDAKMPVDKTTISMHKDWVNSLDTRVGEAVTLNVVDESGKVWVTKTLNKDNNWTASNIYIAPGVIANGTVLEYGHDYTVVESSTDAYHWELSADTYHPMIINGTLTQLKKVASGGTYTINGNQYRVVSDDSIVLNATNSRRSNLNISKVVEGYDSSDTNSEFVFTITVTDAKNQPIYFSVYDTISEKTVTPTTSNNVTPERGQDDKLTGYYTVASGTQFTVNMKHGWNLRVTNLLTGSTYTVTESSMPDGYIFKSVNSPVTVSSVSADNPKTVTGTIAAPNTNYRITYTNTKTFNVTVNKVWNDDNNADNIRAQYGVTLYANGVAVGDEVTLAARDTTYTWSNLDKFDANGEEITYTVKETTVPAEYVSSTETVNARVDSNGVATIINTHVSNSSTDNPYITVTKTFSGITATQIPSDDFTITLSQNNVTKATLGMSGNENAVAPVSVSEDGLTYTWKLDNLPAGTYNVTESGMEITGYDLTVTGIGEENATSGSVTTTPSTLDITNVKRVPNCNNLENPISTNFNFVVASTTEGDYIIWTQTQLSSAQREAFITKFNSSATGDIAHITSDKALWYSGEALNNKISVRGATVQYTGGKLIFSASRQWKMFAYGNYRIGATESADIAIVNSYTPITENITVTKVWADNGNQDGKRPGSVTVKLKANDKVVEDKVVTLSSSNSWRATFENLPKYENGQEIVYSVVEENVPGYTASYSDLQNGTITVTNTHTPEKRNITVAKEWADNNNQDGIRPNSVTVQLKANDTVVEGKVVTLSNSNSWTATFEDLPKFANGTEIAYSVVETEVPEGYEVSYSEIQNGTITITNSHEVETKKITVTKVWDDRNNRNGIRPDIVTFTVTGSDGKTYEATLSASADNPTANTWTAEVEVEKYHNGVEVTTFTVDENNVPTGYEKSVVDGTLTVKNTLETADLKVEKIFGEGNMFTGDAAKAKEFELTVTAELDKDFGANFSNGDTEFTKVSNQTDSDTTDSVMPTTYNYTATATLTAGQSITFTDLPIGTYSVEENEEDAQVMGYSLEVALPDPVTLVNAESDNGETPTLSVTNTYTVLKARLEIAKILTEINTTFNNDNATFVFEVVGTVGEGESKETIFDQYVTIIANRGTVENEAYIETIDVPYLPNAKYTVTEVSSGIYTETNAVNDELPSVDGETIIITGQDQIPVVYLGRAQFTNEYDGSHAFSGGVVNSYDGEKFTSITQPTATGPLGPVAAAMTPEDIDKTAVLPEESVDANIESKETEDPVND
ncbi:MAG: Cna B-type domain-containing protein [Oscillospiraceae bacterium]|nr:Cna B-type domain-containing protein [Oscillospiraceae bacterium]